VVLNKKFLTVFLISVFLIVSSITFIPKDLFAQEEGEEELISLPEDLTIDVSFNEVVNYGIIGASFEFGLDVTYTGNDPKTFEFIADIPDGWEYEVTPGFGDKEITKIKLKPDELENLKFTLRPLVPQDEGEYDVNLSIASIEEGDDLEGSVDLLAIVKPSGDLKLSSKNGRVNTEISKTRDNEFILLIENIGTGPVEEIEISVVDQPEGWLIEYENKIRIIDVGEVIELKAKIMPDQRTIAGDYDIRFLAQSDESSAFVDIRTTVKVPLVWQITGIAIIVIVIAGIAVLFERLGRR